MDIIDEHLATSTLNDRYEPSIIAALTVGKKLLNKYYNMTDHSEVYRITMGTLFTLASGENSFICDNSPPPRPQARLLQIGKMG
jgi:hypothetical protein